MQLGFFCDQRLFRDGKQDGNAPRMMPASIEWAGEKAGIGGSELGFEVWFRLERDCPFGCK